jgi:hypothetical protein
MNKFISLLLLKVVFITSALGQILPDPGSLPEKYYPSSTKVIKLGNIKALRDIAPHKSELQPPSEKTWTKSNYFKSNELRNPHPQPQGGDPLAAASLKNSAEKVAAEITPGLNFEGLGDLSGVTPPDPVGDVGLNHYVQMVNSSNGAWFQVWNKQGQSVYGPALTSTIWSQVQSGSIGDPIIQYDHDAQRWLMMEMQGFSDNQLLIAVSDDSDPTGSWKAYRVQCQGFPDYPKLYVWPNAYFVTINEIVETNKCSGYALDRAALLAGDAEISTYRFEMPNFQAIRYQPATGADWEGGPPPPPGSPGLIFRLYDDAWDGGTDQIQLWQIFVDWNNPTQNFALGPTSFHTTPFETRVCYGSGLFNCIEQPGFPATPRLTALENIIMYRAPYRNFGTYESIVLNHVTDISAEVGDGGDAGIRWYEFRKNNGEPNWSIFQEGTYAPDLNNRFTGTISQDVQGSMAIGYTTTSSITFPGIRVTGRRISDAPGTMPVEEYTLIPGGQSHMGDSRWGDYSNMSVDPVDGKTFWYVSEYQPSGAPWGTRIGTFQIRRDSYDITPTVVTAPVNSALLDNQQVTIKILNGGLNTASNFSADLYADGILLSTEPVSGTILPNGILEYTFQPLLSWNAIGEKKNLMVITHWIKDVFPRNDTLRTTIKKLASFDVAIAGTFGLPNLICATEHTFGLILRNASGLPLDSTQIRWNINTGPATTIFWYGHLLPGEQDTVPIALTGLTGVQNLFKARTLLPNGQMDQDSLNDKIQQKLYSNLQGAFLTIKAKTDIGILYYEIKDASNNVLDKGTFSSGEQTTQICSGNATCYKLVLKSLTFRWEGAIELYDLFGNLLASQFEATPAASSTSFCTPGRKQVDVGAFGLLSPSSGPNLTGTEVVTIAVRNFGLTPQENISVMWREENGIWNTETMTESIPGGLTKSFSFAGSAANLSTPGAGKNLEIKATVTGDEKPENDTRTFKVTHKVQRDLALLDMESIACYSPTGNSIRLLIENTGLTTVDSFEVSYVLNGIPGTAVITGADLAPGQQQKQIIQIGNGQIGTNQLTANISRVNTSGNDDYESNDEKIITYSIDPNKIAIDLYLGLDDSPRETSWELRYAGGSLVSTGGEYSEKQGAVYERFCLDKDSCLIFTLFDSGNNGMEGSVLLQQQNSNFPIWSFYGVTDTFSKKIIVPFCATTLCGGFSATFSITDASNNAASDGSIQVDIAGGVAPYRYSINNMAPQAGNTFGGLVPGDYIILVLDANDCPYSSVATVKTVSGVTANVPLRAVTVTPNPTSGLFWIKMPAKTSEQFADCTVYDASGKVVRKFQMARFDQELVGACSLEKNAAGTYFVVVSQKSGFRIAEKRIQKIN